MRAEGASIIIAESYEHILQLHSSLPVTGTELHSDRLMF
jgi:hypothetical protein